MGVTNQMARKKEYPEIGDRQNGQTLVAMGDDFPDEWIFWLEDLVEEYGELVTSLESVDISVEGLDLSASSSSKMEFAEALGITFSSSFWEGDHISGYFQMGWITTKEIPKAKKAGKILLKQRLELIRTELIKEFVTSLDSLDIHELVARIRFDPIEQCAEIDHLTKAETLAEETRSNLLNLLEMRTNEVSAVALASQECIFFAVSMQNPTDNPIIAGPVALWRGEIFVICGQGGVRPPTSPYDDLLRSLRATGRKIIDINDETVIGRSPLSGRVALLKGSGQLADWQNIWAMKMPHKRIFKAEDPENSQKAVDLYHLLLSHSSSDTR
jgi:hypothetical protein